MDNYSKRTTTQREQGLRTKLSSFPSVFTQERPRQKRPNQKRCTKGNLVGVEKEIFIKKFKTEGVTSICKSEFVNFQRLTLYIKFRH